MSFKDTYEKELVHIRDTAKKYASKYPNIAPFLENHSQDQDIERLIESFAFLTAKVNQRLDDGVPELSQNIFQTIWPNFLSVIPAMTIMQFDLNEKPKDQLLKISKDTDLTNIFADKKISFKPLFDVNLYPISLNKVKSDLYDIREVIDLDFSVGYQMSLLDFTDINLPIHITGNHSNSLKIAYLLKRKLLKIEILDLDNKNIEGLDISLTEMDLTECIDIKKTQPDVFSLITYYFRYPEVFNYVNLNIKHNGKNVKDLIKHKKFKVRITVDLDGMEYTSVTTNQLLLYTAPAVNIQKASITPIFFDNKTKSYRLRLDDNDNQAITRITKVSNLAKNSTQKQEIFKWNDFDNSFKNKPLYKQFVFNNAISGKPEFDITIQNSVKENTYISIEGQSFCTNAHELIGLGDFKQADKKSLYGYKNITHVSSPLIPNYSAKNLWELTNYMSVRVSKTIEKESIQKMIALFNNIELYSKSQQKSLTQKVINSIKQVNIDIDESYYKRRIVRGNVISVIINEQSFLNEGDIYLFGSVLSTIFNSLAEVNSYNTLRFIGMERGSILEWKHA